MWLKNLSLGAMLLILTFQTAPAVVFNVGQLPGGATITITFNALINNPLIGGATQLSAKGIVSGSNFAPVMTDDPDTPDPLDPTLTGLFVPPIAVCQDATATADLVCSASVAASVFDNGSFDPDGGSVSLAISPTGPFGLGVHLITLIVTDDELDSATCMATLTVQDTTLPTASCPPKFFVTADGSGMATVPDITGDVVAFDNCTIEANLLIAQSPVSGTMVGIGDTDITVFVEDESGNIQSCTTTMTVVEPTATPTSTETNTITETPTETLSPTFTETLTETGTPTETSTISETPTSTETPTITNTGDPTATETTTPTVTSTFDLSPTETPTLPAGFVFSATFQVSCSGLVSSTSSPFEIALLPGMPPTVCAPIPCPSTDVLNACLFDCAGLAPGRLTSCTSVLNNFSSAFIACMSLVPGVTAAVVSSDTSSIEILLQSTFEGYFCLCGNDVGVPCGTEMGLPMIGCNISGLCGGLDIEVELGTAPVVTPTPTLTETLVETPTPTPTTTDIPVSETPTETSTETQVGPSATPTETATSTDVPTITETATNADVPTPTETATSTELGLTATPSQTFTATATATEPFVCVQAANINLYCLGQISPSAEPLHLKLHAGVLSATTCAPAACDGPVIADATLDLALLSSSTCETAFDQLSSLIISAIESQTGGSIVATTLGQPEGSIFIQSETPFYCCICTEEAGLPCNNVDGWPIGICGLFNLGDGINGNETDFGGFTGGIGIECVDALCEVSTPTPTPTETTPALTPTATETEGPSLTPTITQTPGCDSGLYLLLTTGQLERVGEPPVITGGFNFGIDLAKNLERAIANNAIPPTEDLTVLDGTGMVSFVENAGDNIPQDFLFPTSVGFPMGRAVDFSMTQSSEGFWVLTDFGGIYRAGDAKEPADPSEVPGTSQMGILGYDIPFGALRAGGLANPGGASLRAVALVVIDANAPFNRADGYIVFDSQGGRYQFNPDGTPVVPGTYSGAPANDPLRLLEPEPAGYVWPFFAGLDIARDVELFPTTQEGVVVFDGWGGIHPVPVDDPTNAVFFARNEDPNNPGNLITTVGMPYLVVGFDDPETAEDESDPLTYGIDAYSIFVDLDFSAGCEDGFYTLSKFGEVFVFGSARVQPNQLTPAWPIPYVTSQNAIDIELYAFDETGFVPQNGTR